MASAKDSHSLTTWFEQAYLKAYGNKPVVNRNTARWSFDSMLQSLSVSEVKSLIDYYFTTDSTNRHSLQWFFYNYDKLIVGRQDQLDDADHRAHLRAESERRAQEWRDRFGNQGITSN